MDSNTGQIASIILAIGTVLGVLLAYFKRKPGEERREDQTVAEGQLNLAQGSIALVTATLNDQFARLAIRQAAVEAQVLALQEALAHEREQRRMSNGYARTLAQVLRQNNIVVPMPPPDLDMD